MSDNQESARQGAVEAAAGRVIGLEAELEASGTATTAGDALAWSRDVLHRWVDTVTGVVVTPGVGRVVLIHADGRESRIASADLPMQLSAPVTFGGSEPQS